MDVPIENTSPPRRQAKKRTSFTTAYFYVNSDARNTVSGNDEGKKEIFNIFKHASPSVMRDLSESKSDSFFMTVGKT